MTAEMNEINVCVPSCFRNSLWIHWGTRLKRSWRWLVSLSSPPLLSLPSAPHSILGGNNIYSRTQALPLTQPLMSTMKHFWELICTWSVTLLSASILTTCYWMNFASISSFNPQDFCTSPTLQIKKQVRRSDVTFPAIKPQTGRGRAQPQTS